MTLAQIAQWSERTENDTRVLEVRLKQRTLGNCALQLQLVRPHKELPKTMEMAGVRPAIRSAVMRAEPCDMVQPMWPCPVLR